MTEKMLTFLIYGPVRSSRRRVGDGIKGVKRGHRYYSPIRVSIRWKSFAISSNNISITVGALSNVALYTIVLGNLFIRSTRDRGLTQLTFARRYN